MNETIVWIITNRVGEFVLATTKMNPGMIKLVQDNKFKSYMVWLSDVCNPATFVKSEELVDSCAALGIIDTVCKDAVHNF